MYRYAAVAIVLASVGAAAQGQVSWNPLYVGWGYGYTPSEMALVWDGNAITPTATQEADGIHVTYDATVVPVFPYQVSSVGWNFQAQGWFHVGPVPVEASLTMRVNGKLVNSGGDDDQPTTGLGWSASLYYDLDDSHNISMGDVRVDAFNLNSGAFSVTGNGLEVIDDTRAMADTFILAPEFNYILCYSQGWTVSDLPTVPLASTFECGGETAYDGITLTLDATPVPEPATMTLLALGACLPLLCRRK